jgi:hypothetical protein
MLKDNDLYTGEIETVLSLLFPSHPTARMQNQKVSGSSTAEMYEMNKDRDKDKGMGIEMGRTCI